MLLGVVIVTHNHQEAVARCLDSLEKAGAGDRCAVVVYDAGSTDESARIVRDHPLGPVLVTGDNIGFGAGSNLGAAALPSGVTHLWFLNPDTVIPFDIIDFEQRLEPLSFGCLGIRQLDLDGHLVWSWDEFPGVALEWRKALGLPLLQRSAAGYLQDRTVDWLMGSFLVLPREVFDLLGGFDERYFLFCEEIDLCRRLQDLHLTVYYLNDPHYLHQRGGKDTVWREVLRLNSRRTYDARWLPRYASVMCQAAQTLRWVRSLAPWASKQQRRYAWVRLLATWNCMHAITHGPLRGRTRFR